MRTYTVNLSSNQFIGVPGLADSLTFNTPLSTLSAAADGGSFGSTPTYLQQYNDGSFFPWEFIIQSFTTNIILNPLKGPYTLIFSTSGLDTSLFGIFKIFYNFGDGTKQTVNYPIGKSFAGVALLETPGNTNISHDYYPLSLSGTTYTPSITVINGNLVSFIYNISASFFPSSIYEISDTHLLNSISVGVSSNELLNIFETCSPNYITHALTLSA